MKIALLKNVVKKDPKDSNCTRKSSYMEMESALVIPFNASFVFKLWSCHQNDKRFKDNPKGNQCKCSALVYLAMNFGIDNQALVDLDSYLNIGEHVYKTTVGQ